MKFLSLATMLALTAGCLAQSDSVSLSFSVWTEDGPIAGALVYFHPFQTFGVTDLDGVVAFDTGSATVGYYPKDTLFQVSAYHPDHGLMSRQLTTTNCTTCSSYEIAAYRLEFSNTDAAIAGPESSESSDSDATTPGQGGGGAEGPFSVPPLTCNTYEWRIKSSVDLPCATPNGASLGCVTYVNGTPTGPVEIDESNETSAELDAEINAEAQGKLSTFGAKVSTTVSGSRKVVRKSTLKTSAGGNNLPGKCGEVCVRTKVKEVTFQKWKFVCWHNEAGWWGQWVPTGHEQVYSLVTGTCHDISGLTDC